MLAVRNTLNTIYSGQTQIRIPTDADFDDKASDRSLLYTLLGTYEYVLYSGDLPWLRDRWPAYLRVLAISIDSIGDKNLISDQTEFYWAEPGYSLDHTALLHLVLENSIRLASWISQPTKTNGISWFQTKKRLKDGIMSFYCARSKLFSNTLGNHGCDGPQRLRPQLGNSLSLLARISRSGSPEVSKSLQARWIQYGAPIVESPNSINAFSSSLELLGHMAANNVGEAIELVEMMWGYMLDRPRMTKSTLLEGYRVDGFVHNPVYASPSRNSHAHASATGPNTLLMQGVLGIKFLAPLGQRWRIEPYLSKWLRYAQGGFCSKRGKFQVNITLSEHQGTNRRVDIEVPPGTSGTVIWAQKEIPISIAMSRANTRSSFYRYLDGSEHERRSVLPLHWLKRSDYIAVTDRKWIKPKVTRRPEWVVDFHQMRMQYHTFEREAVESGRPESSAHPLRYADFADGPLGPKADLDEIEIERIAEASESNVMEDRILMEKLDSYFSPKNATPTPAFKRPDNWQPSAAIELDRLKNIREQLRNHFFNSLPDFHSVVRLDDYTDDPDVTNSSIMEPMRRFRLRYDALLSKAERMTSAEDIRYESERLHNEFHDYY